MRRAMTTIALCAVLTAWPSAVFATNPGPPNVEVVPPEAILGDDGGLVGFVAGSLLITFGDGSQLRCILDPAVPPNPCTEVSRG